MSLMMSLLFIIGFIALFTSVFCLKKSDNEQNAFSWIIVSIIVCMAFNAFFAGVINLVHIPINIVSIGMGDLFVGGILHAYIYRKHNFQSYLWNKEDFIFLIFYSLIIGRFCVVQFSGLNPNFQAIDAPHHLQAVENIVFNKNIMSSMFYSDLYGCLIVEILEPLFGIENYYKSFVISEIINLFLAGLSFYAVLADKIKKGVHYIFAIVLTLLYVFGYPVCNLQYGFVYWGMSITVITCIAFICNCLRKEDMCEKYMYIVLIFLNFAVFESYAMFVPPVFLSEFIFCMYIRKHKIFSKKNIINMIITFLPAIILGMVYSIGLLQYANLSIGSTGGGESSPSGIVLEGGIYKDLYKDYIMYIIFSITALLVMIKKRKLSYECFSTGCVFFYMILMFIGGMNGRVSSYYYCKNNYMMWLLIIILAYDGIIYIWEKQKEVIISYGLVLLILFGLFFSSLETKIQARNSNYEFGSVTDCLKIYSHNRQMVNDSRYSREYIEVYKMLYKKYVEKGYSVAVSSDFWLHETWFNVVTNQKFTVCESNYELYLSECEEKADYVLVFYDSFYQNNAQHYDEFERVEDYGFGFLIRKMA